MTRVGLGSRGSTLLLDRLEQIGGRAIMQEECPTPQSGAARN
jgi:hypothetical protein